MEDLSDEELHTLLYAHALEERGTEEAVIAQARDDRLLSREEA